MASKTSRRPDAAEYLLADLRRSGLGAPKDVKKLGVELLSSEETARLTRWRVPSYRIPYMDTAGRPTDFFRLKLLWDAPEGNVIPFRPKKPQKYWQPPGSECALYFPPFTDWADVLGTNETTIYITEGEKKAARACKAGFPTVGLGGVDNWYGAPLRALDAMNLQGRRVVIVFDTPDTTTNQRVQRAERQLAEELRRCEASVFLCRLPEGDGKVGLDDFLEAHGREAFSRLEHTEFSAPIEHTTDLGNAGRLLRLHGPDLRHSPKLGWLIWNGTRWEPDESGEIMRRAKDTARMMDAEALRTEDPDLRKRLRKWATESEGVSRLEAMVKLATTEPGMHVHIETLGADPMLLGVANGVIDLRTGIRHEARRDDLITKHSPVPYDPDAECPTFCRFLDRIFAGNVELIRYVRRALGYSLTGLTAEQCFFLLYGTGENGKSQFLAALESLLGEYAMTTPTETLMATRQPRGIPNDIARLRGARGVTAIETEQGRRLSESLVKQLTGGDKIAARFLHKEFFEFRPAFKLWLAANHKPVIRGGDHAIWRRIHLIPFLVQIPKKERVKDYFEAKLRPELPGILRYAVEGCLEWQQEGLNPPPLVRDEVTKYRQASDVLGTWIEERCTVGKRKEAPAGNSYESYKTWAKDNEEFVMTNREFRQRMEEKGFPRKKTESGHFYAGIALMDGRAKF